MDLKYFNVKIGGVDHLMQLTEATAKRYGSAAVPATRASKAAPATKAAPEPKNKARKPAANKKATPAKEADESAETDW